VQTVPFENDLLILVVEGDRRSIGLESQVTAHVTWRYAVAVAVERQPEIFVDQSLRGIPIVGHDHR
jgi:hypothetical protein